MASGDGTQFTTASGGEATETSVISVEQSIIKVVSRETTKAKVVRGDDGVVRRESSKRKSLNGEYSRIKVARGENGQIEVSGEEMKMEVESDEGPDEATTAPPTL